MNPSSRNAAGLSPLPIDQELPRLLGSLRQAPNLVLLAETGAGKTTRFPPALLRAGLGEGCVWLIEPRRIAARAAARRIAAESDWHLGEEVGYHVRFDHRAGEATRLLVMTEGILLRRLQSDPFLEGVDALVLDEFHERHLDGDLGLSLARSVQREVRPDLSLVVMSATLVPEPVAAFLGDCPIHRCPGRTHPVEIRHRPRPADEDLAASIAAGVRETLETSSGDILAFLPGLGEIRRAQRFLGETARSRQLEVVPLYGSLPAREQDRALSPGRHRRVVLATNVAESSVTVDGVSAVVDGGYARVPRFDSGVGLDRLETVRISRASADQRAGRAGRQGPGLCLRLWSEHEDSGLRPLEAPEVQRVDVAGAVLQLLSWGEGDPAAFPWFEAPPAASLERADAQLRRLGAVDDHGLTPVGRKLAQLPVPPRLGRLLLEARRRGVLESAALVAAELSERSAFRSSGGGGPLAPVDLTARLQALRQAVAGGAYHRSLDPGGVQRLKAVQKQLCRAVQKNHRLGDDGSARRRASPSSEETHRHLVKALLTAYPERLARRREPGSRQGVLVGGRGVALIADIEGRGHPLFLCLDLDAGRRGEHAEGRVRLAVAVDPVWLPKDKLHEEDATFYDEERDRVLAVRRILFEDLIIDETPRPATAEEAAEALAPAGREDPAKALPQDDRELNGFLQRLRFLAEAMPELGLRPIGEEDLLKHLPLVCTGKRSLEEVRRHPWLDLVKGSLPYHHLQAVEEHAPERLEVPSGSKVRLRYEEQSTTGPEGEVCTEIVPILAVRIQELYGLAETPSLAAGRVPVLLHLLAPNGRPQQITRDLASFWQTTYPQVRKELQGRYAKHAWPENPLQAKPESRPKRRFR